MPMRAGKLCSASCREILYLQRNRFVNARGRMCLPGLFSGRDYGDRTSVSEGGRSLPCGVVDAYAVRDGVDFGCHAGASFLCRLSI